MSSWAKEVLGRLFSSTDSSRAASDTTSSKTRAKPSIDNDAQRSRRHGSLVSAASFLKHGARSKAKASTIKTISTDATNTHRRGQSQPLNSAPAIARLCHTRSRTQSNPISKLPEYVVPVPLPVDQDDEADDADDESPAVTAQDVQHATREALEQTNDAPFLLHDPTIEWEPPTWDDLWRDPARSIRTHSNSRLSTFMRTPKRVNDQNDARTKSSKRERSVSRKSSFEDLRNTVQPKRDGSSSDNAPSRPGPEAGRRTSIKRSTLQKKLPTTPAQMMARPVDASGLPPSYLQENAARNARILKDLQEEGVLDLNNTEDTHTAVIWSPAVTHETRIVQPIEVVQRAVSRDVHNHHIIHRVLPVVDCQVLPARHFVPDGRGGYVEISEDQIPGGKPDSLDRLIAEAVTKSTSSQEGGVVPPTFTSQAREDKSRRKERVSKEGKLETEQWWMHTPSGRSPRLQNSPKREPEKLVEPHPQKMYDTAAPYAQTAQELKRSKPDSSNKKVASTKASNVVQRAKLDYPAELAQERARHQSFKYRTPDGLPSWTAITTEPEQRQQPRPAAYTPVAAAIPEKSQRRPQPIHTILPLHVAYGTAGNKEYA